MNRLAIRIFLFAVMSVFLLAFSPRTKLPSKDEAVELARAEVTKREKWANQASYVAEKNGGGWSVRVYWIAFPTNQGLARIGPDGFRIIVIDRTDKIISYHGL